MSDFQIPIRIREILEQYNYTKLEIPGEVKAAEIQRDIENYIGKGCVRVEFAPPNFFKTWIWWLGDWIEL